MTASTRKRGAMRTLKMVATAIVAGTLMAACDDTPTAPSRQPPPLPQPQNTLELSGQNTIAPGGTSEFTLIAVLADGTRTDVTSVAAWSTNGTSYAASLGQGRVRGVAVGETTLHANYNGRFASREIIVVPDGTFRVTGRVLEQDSVTPVANARIRVRDADDTGLSTTADASGFYRLYGVKAETDFVVTRDGYEETEMRVRIDKHSTVNLSVPLSGPRLTVEGSYTATFEWSRCINGFRDDLRRRVYGAIVKQVGAQLEIRFTDAEFVHNSANRGDLMDGHVDPNGIYVFADSGYYYAYSGAASAAPFLTELLPDSYRLVTYGRAFLAQSGNRFSGKIDGGLELYRRVSQGDAYLGGCSDGNVTFERR